MTGCGPPPGVSLASSWSRVDHNGFGSNKSDLGIFIPRASQCCALSLSLRLSARHSYALPGSCFKKNDKTLVPSPRSALSDFASGTIIPFAPYLRVTT